MRANWCSAHAPHVSPCAEFTGCAWQCPQQEEIAQKRCRGFAPPDDTNESRWLRAVRARAMCDDASSTTEVSYGHCEPWHKPWCEHRAWTGSDGWAASARLEERLSLSSLFSVFRSRYGSGYNQSNTLRVTSALTHDSAYGTGL